MKYIKNIMMLTLFVLPFLFASCDKDDDSNPTLDLSHVAEGFVLNVPAYAENNTYDLAMSDGVQLSCTQPNYGDGVPYVVRYFVQVSIDPTFAEGNKDAKYTELSTSSTKAKFMANAIELNNALVDLYQEANPDADIPSTMPVYIRLRAIIDGSMIENLGETFSNVITLPSVRAEYKAPDVEYPANLYVSLAVLSKMHGAVGSKFLLSMVCQATITPWFMFLQAVPSNGEQPRAIGVALHVLPLMTRLVPEFQITKMTIL